MDAYTHVGSALYLFGRVLLFGHDAARLAVERLPVAKVLDLVDPDQPVLGGEGLLQVLEFDILVPDLGVARPVEARRRSKVQLGDWGGGGGGSKMSEEAQLPGAKK